MAKSRVPAALSAASLVSFMHQFSQLLLVGSLLGPGLLLAGCDIKPDKLFERNAPLVSEAIELLDAGNPEAAAQLLENYLQTGSCDEGQLGITNTARERVSASFDLGLALFALGERFGPRFGLENEGLGSDGPTEEQRQVAGQRTLQVSCALSLLRAISVTKNMPVDLAAHAKYLEGNLEFLRRNYRDAITAYDEALSMIPGLQPDAALGVIGDGVVHKKVTLDKIGADAAWNRAIALRRLEQEQPDAGADSEAHDSEADASEDQSDEQPPQDAADDRQKPQDSSSEKGDSDSSGDGSQDTGSADGGDKNHQNNNPSNGGGDAADSNEPNSQQQPSGDAGEPDSATGQNTTQSQDERVLDTLESAPSVQIEEAKRNAAARSSTRGMVDK